MEFPYAPLQATSPAVRGLHSSVAFPASDQSSPLCHCQSPLEWPVHWVHLCFCFLSCFILILGEKTEKRKDLGTVPCWKESPCQPLPCPSPFLVGVFRCTSVSGHYDGVWSMSRPGCGAENSQAFSSALYSGEMYIPSVQTPRLSSSYLGSRQPIDL